MREDIYRTNDDVETLMNNDYMISFQNETKQAIEKAYKNLTAVERSVADFFIGNKDDMDFSSKNISRSLYVSEATLSRFSQKCGYKGYREFIFSYERDLKYEQRSEENEKDVGLFLSRVHNSYQKLLQENFRIIDEEQIRRLAGMLNISKRVLVFGIGNSGYAAEEFQWRFMRIGLDVNAVTESHMMKISAALAGQETMVIAMTLSGETAEVLESIRIAKSKGASIICVTSASSSTIAQESQEVIQVAALKNLDTGTTISPQFSFLTVMDVLYSYYFANDSYFKTQKYKETLSAIRSQKKTEVKDG
jgi:DNA-binding MurR/RpiR family transcriptional regulator